MMLRDAELGHYSMKLRQRKMKKKHIAEGDAHASFVPGENIMSHELGDFCQITGMVRDFEVAGVG